MRNRRSLRLVHLLRFSVFYVISCFDGDLEISLCRCRCHPDTHSRERIYTRDTRVTCFEIKEVREKERKRHLRGTIPGRLNAESGKIARFVPSCSVLEIHGGSRQISISWSDITNVTQKPIEPSTKWTKSRNTIKDRARDESVRFC